MVSIQNPADLTAPSKEFTFDSAYDPKTSTESIYNDICYPLVEVSVFLNKNNKQGMLTLVMLTNLIWNFVLFVECVGRL